jgi:hypothetical protein
MARPVPMLVFASDFQIKGAAESDAKTTMGTDVPPAQAGVGGWMGKVNECNRLFSSTGGKTSNNCPYQSAWRHFSIHGCDPGSVPCCKQFGRWAMDGKADRLLRRFHCRKSEQTDGLQSGTGHAIWRSGVGVWLRPPMASRRRSPDFQRRPVEIRIALRH